MKNLFYCTFVPGMQDIVAGVVRQRLEDVSIEKLLDGAILFETSCSYDKLNFFCFNNIFAAIEVREKSGFCVPELNTERAGAVISENNKKIKTFRLVCSVENKPASINEAVRQDIENIIIRYSARSGGTALKVDRHRPDTEFWLLCRREGFSVFMKRMTRSVEKKLHPGELPPQLAWLLCYVGELKQGETVIDPFCGYGSIAEAALKHFHIGKFLASDLDPRCVKITRSRPSLKSERCEIRSVDIFSVLEFIPEGSVDAVVTDPPWGMYKETQIPLKKFYEEALALFSKLLRNGGRAVILSAAREDLESAALKTRGLSMEQVIPVLVSGKKAAVYRIVKRT